MKPTLAPAPEARKDRRLVGLLALAVLLLGVAAGVELCRRMFLNRSAAEGMAGDFADFKLPPPAPPEPPPEPEPAPAPIREASAGRFLNILARETPRPVARRFLTAFSQDPGLRKVFQNATRRGLEKTPARELVGALMRERTFRDIVVEFRSDPGFRQAFAQLAKNPEVGGTLRSGTLSLVRAPGGAGLPAAPVGGSGGGPSYAAAGPYAGAVAPNTLEESPKVAQPPADEQREQAFGSEAHKVDRKLEGLKAAGQGRAAGLHFASAFAGLSKQEMKTLEQKYDELVDGPIDPITPGVVCAAVDMTARCTEACDRSPTCPQDVREEFGLTGPSQARPEGE